MKPFSHVLRLGVPWSVIYNLKYIHSHKGLEVTYTHRVNIYTYSSDRAIKAFNQQTSCRNLVRISRAQNDLAVITEHLNFCSHRNQGNVRDGGSCHIFGKRKLADCTLESRFHMRQRRHRSWLSKHSWGYLFLGRVVSGTKMSRQELSLNGEQVLLQGNKL